MKNILYNTNSVFGLALSIYGNLDFGKPIRLRSKSIQEYLGRFYNLTHIGLLLSTFTFIIGLFYRNRAAYALDSWTVDIIHEVYINMLAITVTAECFIPIIFWFLWKIDKGFVVTTSSFVGEDTISLFFNLCMHGFPTFFLLVEFFCSEFLAKNSHYVLLFFFFSMYLGIMLIFNTKTGFWPYDIINILTGWYRVVFFSGCFVFLCFLYFLLSYMHFLLWRGRARSKGRKRGKDKE